MLNSAAINHRSMGIASLHPSYASGSGVCFNVGWVEARRRYPPIRLHRGVNPFYFPVVADYRRNFIPGGSYFFTVNLADRRSRLLTDKIGLLRSALRTVMQRHPFTTEAVVVLPEHLHCIWTLPPGDTDFATRWRLIGRTSRSRLAPASAVHRAALAKVSAESGNDVLGAHAAR